MNKYGESHCCERVRLFAARKGRLSGPGGPERGTRSHGRRHGQGRFDMLQDTDNNLPEADGENKRRTVLEERIREKIADYTYYKFTVRQTRALNIFFDLAQEYEDLNYLYLLPVQVLHFFFNVNVELYARDDSGKFVVQTPKTGPAVPLPPLGDLAMGPAASGPWWFFAVKGRPGSKGGAAKRAKDRRTTERRGGRRDEREILALLAVRPDMALTEHDKLFYEKFANRVGFSLHNRLLALKNLEHIEFVRTLVHDIGHNVIVPNLHFKLLMRQMAGKIDALRELSQTLSTQSESDAASLYTLCERIEAHYQEISKHFQQSSFFLETLLRQSHFDQGRYVLQRTRFDLAERVVAPQMERYRMRFEERDIVVEDIYEATGADLMVNADMGLLSQVVANLLSNAVKYTRETPGGRKGLFVRCRVLAVPGHFGEARDGVRVEVFSTGPAVPENERDRLFAESFRASNAHDEQGTGHGLYFSRLIISQHGGDCGYRRDKDCNVFYLTLPVDRSEPGSAGGGRPAISAEQGSDPSLIRYSGREV